MRLDILNPVAQRVEEKGPSAPRLPKLEGKLIGLYWNNRPGGDTALKRVGELLKSRYAGLETKIYVPSFKKSPSAAGSIGDASRSVIKEELKRIAQECAGVIGSTAD